MVSFINRRLFFSSSNHVLNSFLSQSYQSSSFQNTLFRNLYPKKEFSSSVNEDEIKKFSAMANDWWNPKGPLRGLHDMNPIRISFIRNAICKHFKLDSKNYLPFKDLKMIDVGCGGGLVCEPLSRMGADIVGLDATLNNIKMAEIHSSKDPHTKKIKYIHSTAEELVKKEQKFDVVLSLEVIEHVNDPIQFIQNLTKLCKNDGILILSTINRSFKSYIFAIWAAENVLGWVQPGTHDWSKFLSPLEIGLMLKKEDFKVEELSGIVFHPLTQSWYLDKEDDSINYILVSKHA